MIKELKRSKWNEFEDWNLYKIIEKVIVNSELDTYLIEEQIKWDTIKLILKLDEADIRYVFFNSDNLKINLEV